jgi:hypothetical protein
MKRNRRLEGKIAVITGAANSIGRALPVDGGNTASLNLPGMKF